ncbi:hypothetical protein N658DRAFT_499758 [Parathielavia hyrcaniae]|uniref:Uncharacterized protein n=1 Tax=Parathielavia hyrcaniae TaxID=113614 RepID=A0AAN6PZB7_9PEZI|nr:hypothetical protein N658DRAFT_499758 [Parathielavia hyrcaniae]
MSCFIKTHQTDADTVRLRLQLFSTAWTHSEYLAQGSDQPWVWRTPSPNITCQAFHFLTDDNWTENRHGIHLHASESCPAAVVLLATRGAAFWHSAYILRRRRPMGQEKLIQGFKRLTSNAQWQDNPRELGPVCEQRLPFGGDKCLVVTLCLEKGSDGLGSSKRVYKVYLAVEDRGPQVPRR